MITTIGVVIAAIIGFVVYTIGIIFSSRKFERQKIRNTIAEKQIENIDTIDRKIKEYEIRKADIKKRFANSPAKRVNELSKLGLEYSDIAD